jgi:O-antigen/teichoic acid export membrane protein
MTDPAAHNSLPITFLGSFSRKLIANTFFNFLGRFWSLAATLLLTPFIWRHLTADEFGAWVLFAVFLESLSLLDLGIGSAFVKFISASHANEEYDRINKILLSSLLFHAVHGTLLLVIGLAVRDPLFDFFEIRGAESAYFLALVACVTGNVAVMLLSVFRGVQRMDKSNAIEMAMSILNVIGTVVVLQAGWRLWGLALNALLNAVIAVIVASWSVKRTMPWVSLSVQFDGRLLREMFSYGAQILVSRMGTLVCFRIDKLIVARFLGLGIVPVYEVSARLSSLVRALPLLMMSALIPATSELGARNDKDKILQTYMMTSKYVVLVTVGAVAFVVVEAHSILRLWLGEGLEQSVILVQILVIGYGANVLAGAASQTGAGVGRPEFDMHSTILLAVLAPVLGLLLVPRFGAIGVAAGTSLSLAVAAFYLLVAFHRNYLETSVVGMILGIYARPIAAGILAIITVVGFHRVFPGLGALNETRYLIPAKLAMDFAVFAPVYGLFLVVARQVTAIDRRNFLGLVNFGFEVVRHPFREWVKIYR